MTLTDSSSDNANDTDNSGNTDVDIAIVGGGLVGAPLALMLAAQGWSVALLEREARPRQFLSGSKGYTAVSHASVELLEAFDLWHTDTHRAQAIEQVHVSHKGYFGNTRISAHEHRVPALGYVVDNSDYLNSLEGQLRDSNVQLVSEALVQQTSFQPEHASVQYTEQSVTRELTAQLVIGVDGVRSQVRQSAGIGTRQVDYEQVGVLGLLGLSTGHNNVAYERFTPSGPLALLPRPDNAASYVYCIDTKQQDEVNSWDDDTFLAHLQNEFGYRLGQFTQVHSRYTVPLMHISSSQQVAERLLLLGSAMRLMHPVGGQGYNLAMRDVGALLSLLGNNVGNGKSDPGDSTALREYAAARQGDHEAVVRMTDALARTFRGKASLPAHLRSLGLLTLDMVSPLKNRFARYSMGLR